MSSSGNPEPAPAPAKRAKKGGTPSSARGIGTDPSLVESADSCHWGTTSDAMKFYHEQEWGQFDKNSSDETHFEFCVLESAQAGLSWSTVLHKRSHYRRLFPDARSVSCFTEKDVDRILQDPGIIRNRAKVKAAVSNAKVFMDVVAEYGSFCRYLISFCMPADQKLRPEELAAAPLDRLRSYRIINRWRHISELPAQTALSDAVSADLKARGFKFFGSKICYAHMQAVGIVNDHIVSCKCYKLCS